MTTFVVVLLFLLGSCAGEVRKEDVDDDDFDEFEFDFGDEEEEEAEIENDDDEDSESEEDDEEDMIVEDEFDSEEFEDDSQDGQKKQKGSSDSDELEILESTVEIKPVWEAYITEGCIVLGIILYFSNYILGKTKSTQIAETWAAVNMNVLKDNFTIVGDDGEGDTPTEAHVVRRADNSFTIWASGRVNCDGLLIHIELMKRHDLFSILYGIVRPSFDTVSFIFQLASADMDTIICAVSPHKTAAKIQKDYDDISNFCSGIRSGDKHGLPNSFSVLSESFDAANSVLSGQISSFLSKHADLFMSLHVSDQYTGLKEDGSEDSDKIVVKQPERRIHLTFKLPAKTEESVELLFFALKFLDHVKGIRLSREGKDKAQKNRQKVIHNQEKLQHQQRQEAAQQRRDEKRKADKDKILYETDPDKARKLEEKEHKKQLKKNSAKMKQMKVRMG